MVPNQDSLPLLKKVTQQFPSTYLFLGGCIRCGKALVSTVAQQFFPKERHSLFAVVIDILHLLRTYWHYILFLQELFSCSCLKLLGCSVLVFGVFVVRRCWLSSCIFFFPLLFFYLVRLYLFINLGCSPISACHIHSDDSQIWQDPSFLSLKESSGLKLILPQLLCLISLLLQCSIKVTLPLIVTQVFPRLQVISSLLSELIAIFRFIQVCQIVQVFLQAATSGNYHACKSSVGSSLVKYFLTFYTT